MSGELRLVFDTCPEPISWHTHSLARRLPSPQLLVKPALSQVHAFLQTYLKTRALFLSGTVHTCLCRRTPRPGNVYPETEAPHFHKHEVTEEEAEEVLFDPGEDRSGDRGSRVAIGKTRAGRYLRIIYVSDPESDSVFVITGCELRGKPLTAYRRRRRRKRR